MSFFEEPSDFRTNRQYIWSKKICILIVNVIIIWKVCSIVTLCIYIQSENIPMKLKTMFLRLNFHNSFHNVFLIPSLLDSEIFKDTPSAFSKISHSLLIALVKKIGNTVRVLNKSLRYLVPWMNHLSHVWWANFSVHSFKLLLAWKFGMTESNFLLIVFACIYVCIITFKCSFSNNSFYTEYCHQWMQFRVFRKHT